MIRLIVRKPRCDGQGARCDGQGSPSHPSVTDKAPGVTDKPSVTLGRLSVTFCLAFFERDGRVTDNLSVTFRSGDQNVTDV